MRALTVLGLLLAAEPAIAKVKVVVPEVDWSAVVPYVRANIVVERHGAEDQVFVCGAHTNRSVTEPFDEALSDFAMVLITQSMREDRRVSNGIQEAADAFREEWRNRDVDRGAYESAFWRLLSDSKDVLPRLRTRFEAARAKGWLKCWVCDHEPTYAPACPRLNGAPS